MFSSIKNLYSIKIILYVIYSTQVGTWKFTAFQLVDIHIYSCNVKYIK
jgi:hypothetical protein